MALTPESALCKDKIDAVRDMSGTLQHRHFSIIAGIVAEIADTAEREKIARLFADKLCSTNPRFDHARFLRACGVPA